ncbi:MAG: hypothetical protein WA004_18485 [Saprospiraceae bacterium]
MRIIGNIDHPDWKITVFKMDNRLSVKLETGLYEQIYKFRQGEGMETLEDIRAFLDQDFLVAAARHFSSMHQARLAAQARKVSIAGEDSFDEII